MTSAEPSWVGEELIDVRAPLIIDGVATAWDAARLRHEFAGWLAVDAPADVVDDVVLAVYEAVANAAEHAYADAIDGAGPIRLAAHRCADSIVIIVADSGRWRSPRRSGLRGRGLPTIGLLVHDLHINPGDEGTTVHLRVTLPRPDSNA